MGSFLVLGCSLGSAMGQVLRIFSFKMEAQDAVGLASQEISWNSTYKKKMFQTFLSLIEKLTQQCINEPDSIFENVYKVEPGQIVQFQSGKLSKQKYWDIASVYHTKKQEPVGSYKQAKEELKAILKDSVKKRMIADVPVGAFLSGGYDSSLVTAIAQEVSFGPVKTYSIGFEEERYNEAKYAKSSCQASRDKPYRIFYR